MGLVSLVIGNKCIKITVYPFALHGGTSVSITVEAIFRMVLNGALLDIGQFPFDSAVSATHLPAFSSGPR